MTRPSKSSPPASAQLFSDAHLPAPPAAVHIANIDGASRGNPGPASYAVVLRGPDAKIVLELAKNIGRETNNVAEYYALLAALDYATSQGIQALRIRSDSELLVRQMQGRYKVKSADLKPLHERAAKLARQLQYFKIEHVRRELNSDADALANLALDQAGAAKYDPKSSRTLASSQNPGQPPRAASNPPASASRTPATFRARFQNGVLVPAEPLDLPEGSEVTIDIRIPLNK